LSRGVEPKPSASHDAWLAEKHRDGCAYGPVKDPVKRLHPCYVSYEQLPFEQKIKDYIFASIVRAFWQAEQDTQ
jgi:hypothetical protein